jgi:hypothetical protein
LPEPLETGLRHRLKRVVRQMGEQHRHLKPLFSQIAEGVARGESLRELHGHLAHYREAIEAHFALESDMFFPALHGLRPEWGEQLERLDREHIRLVEDLADLVRRIEKDDGATALDEFAARLREHELLEEDLVARLTATLD